MINNSKYIHYSKILAFRSDKALPIDKTNHPYLTKNQE